MKAEDDNAHLLSQVFQSAKVRNYCNNKTRLRGREYVLSYTVFGKNSWEKFGKRIKTVAENATKSSFYRDWKVRVYHDLYPVESQNNLTKIYKNLEFCDVRNLAIPFLRGLKISSINGMMWRFIPMADPTVSIMCSRDLDSDLLKREEDAVHYWMLTKKTLHSMRDHPSHGIEILGGMWCYRTTNSLIKASRNLKVMLKNAERRSSTEAKKGDDQIVLQKYLWPELKNDVIQHDSYLCKYYPGSIPYPSQRSATNEFIGCPKFTIEEACSVPKVCPKDCRPRDHQDWIYC